MSSPPKNIALITAITIAIVAMKASALIIFISTPLNVQLAGLANK